MIAKRGHLVYVDVLWIAHVSVEEAQNNQDILHFLNNATMNTEFQS